MSATFDVHEHRSELKQLRDSGDTELYENPEGLACPACGKRFGKLFVTSKRTTCFPENDGTRFCILRGEEDVKLFRH